MTSPDQPKRTHPQPTSGRYTPAGPIVTATRWWQHGDHPEDDPDNGHLYVRRYDPDVAAYAHAITNSLGFHNFLQAVHTENSKCTATLDEHGYILRAVRDTPEGTISGLIVTVCPGYYIVAEEGNTDVEHTRAVDPAEFHMWFNPINQPQEDWGAAKYRQMALDLDRCIHGRHSTDNCWGCPDGWSTGNLLIPPGTIIGHSLGGRPIVVPPTDQRTKPAAWIQQPSPHWENLARTAAYGSSLARIGAAHLNHTRLYAEHGPDHPDTQQAAAVETQAIAWHHVSFPEAG